MISIQNESFLTKTQKKSLKNLHKREILLIFALSLQELRGKDEKWKKKTTEYNYP